MLHEWRKNFRLKKKGGKTGLGGGKTTSSERNAPGGAKSLKLGLKFKKREEKKRRKKKKGEPSLQKKKSSPRPPCSPPHCRKKDREDAWERKKEGAFFFRGTQTGEKKAPWRTLKKQENQRNPTTAEEKRAVRKCLQKGEIQVGYEKEKNAAGRKEEESGGGGRETVRGGPFRTCESAFRSGEKKGRGGGRFQGNHEISEKKAGGGKRGLHQKGRRDLKMNTEPKGEALKPSRGGKDAS